MKYNFMITEHLRRSVRVEAESAEEACQKVEDLLAEEKIVLTADDFQDRDIQTVDDYENSIGRHGTKLTNDADYEVDEDFSEPEPTFERRMYKGIEFPIRECEWEKGGVTVYRYIGSDAMSEFIFRDGDGTYPDDDARRIDVGIAYYVPHDILMNSSDREILDYISRNIDESVMDIFDETCGDAILRNEEEAGK